nr:hypothetical protein 10 [bacterium]
MAIRQARDEEGRQYVYAAAGFHPQHRFYVDDLRKEEEATLRNVAAELEACRDYMERKHRAGLCEPFISEDTRMRLGRMNGHIKWINIALSHFDRELRRREREQDRENESALKRLCNEKWQKHKQRMAAIAAAPKPQPTEVEPPKVSSFVQPSITRMKQGMEQLREQRDLMLRRINNLEKKLENLKKQKAGAGEAALQRKYDVLLDLLADEFGEAVADGFDLEAANKAIAGAVAVAA